jgi:uncharacterized protein YbcV (DUF1398 family)
MSLLLEKLRAAQLRGSAIRPKVGGFPYLAEALRQAGVRKNIWNLPSCQSIYVFENQAVTVPMRPLTAEAGEIPPFNKEALINALRKDQMGESTFSTFLKSAWSAGVIGYEVDFVRRIVTYRGALDDQYVEAYPAVELKDER